MLLRVVFILGACNASDGVLTGLLCPRCLDQRPSSPSGSYPSPDPIYTSSSSSSFSAASSFSSPPSPSSSPPSPSSSSSSSSPPSPSSSAPCPARMQPCRTCGAVYVQLMTAEMLETPEDFVAEPEQNVPPPPSTPVRRREKRQLPRQLPRAFLRWLSSPQQTLSVTAETKQNRRHAGETGGCSTRRERGDRQMEIKRQREFRGNWRRCTGWRALCVSQRMQRQSEKALRVAAAASEEAVAAAVPRESPASTSDEEVCAANRKTSGAEEPADGRRKKKGTRSKARGRKKPSETAFQRMKEKARHVSR
ncbi:UNVERIFIED_CONTAM: hypothetical protein HHA_453000 [Hammondia hammondi]|eukprot:XP_008886247.1 hypothetical protein HHA_453000 [Hammondia hammondi]